VRGCCVVDSVLWRTLTFIPLPHTHFLLLSSPSLCFSSTLPLACNCSPPPCFFSRLRYFPTPSISLSRLLCSPTLPFTSPPLVCLTLPLSSTYPVGRRARNTRVFEYTCRMTQ